MLSYKRGKPFCIIRGGSKDGKVLKIHDGTKKDDEYNIKEKKLKKFTPHQLSLLKDAMEQENDKILDDIYCLLIKYFQKHDIISNII